LAGSAKLSDSLQSVKCDVIADFLDIAFAKSAGVTYFFIQRLRDLPHFHNLLPMSLNEIWEAAAGSPFTPAVSKDYQLTLGFALLLTGVVLTILFGLNRSFISLPLYAIPASLAFAFGAVYTICGVGVYV
jgi:hypothetical protein